MLGWYYGEIANCNFIRLGGDGIRSVVDLDLNANPDVTSSVLFVRAVWFERLGGWGFRDMSQVQGAPAWSSDDCCVRPLPRWWRACPQQLARLHQCSFSRLRLAR